MNEIEYKTIQAIFNLDKNTTVDEVDLSKKAKVFNENEIKSMLQNYSDSEDKPTNNS
jgi:hypothetical protein